MFCPKCGAPADNTDSVSSISSGARKKKNKALIPIMAVIAVAAALIIYLIMPHTVKVPCDYCSRIPSVAYKTQDGTYAHVCRECSKYCMLCGRNKATESYENYFGTIVFACKDCYKEISKY